MLCLLNTGQVVFRVLCLLYRDMSGLPPFLTSVLELQFIAKHSLPWTNGIRSPPEKQAIYFPVFNLRETGTPVISCNLDQKLLLRFMLVANGRFVSECLRITKFTFHELLSQLHNTFL